MLSLPCAQFFERLADSPPGGLGDSGFSEAAPRERWAYLHTLFLNTVPMFRNREPCSSGSSGYGTQDRRVKEGTYQRRACRSLAGFLVSQARALITCNRPREEGGTKPKGQFLLGLSFSTANHSQPLFSRRPLYACLPGCPRSSQVSQSPSS